MKRLVMVLALILGTSMMVNANAIPLKKNASKEVSFRKHKKHRKSRTAKTTDVKSVTTPKK